MKTKSHYAYLMLFLFLAACGGAPTGEQASEEVYAPLTEETTTEPSGEVEKLAKEFAELNCEMMQLTEQLMQEDPEAEARSEEISQRLEVLSKRVEELIDDEDPDEIVAWDLAFQKFWEETDCH